MLFRSASEELSSQATLMKELLSRFKLRQESYSGGYQSQPSHGSSVGVGDDSAESASFGGAKY